MTLGHLEGRLRDVTFLEQRGSQVGAKMSPHLGMHGFVEFCSKFKEWLGAHMKRSWIPRGIGAATGVGPGESVCFAGGVGMGLEWEELYTESGLVGS